MNSDLKEKNKIKVKEMVWKTYFIKLCLYSEYFTGLEIGKIEGWMLNT